MVETSANIIDRAILKESKDQDTVRIRVKI